MTMLPFKGFDSKKSGKIILWSIVLTVFVLSVGFTESRLSHQPVIGLEAKVLDTTGHSFLTKDDLIDIVTIKHGDIISKPISSINMAVLEKCVLSNPFVAEARVFSTIDGKLHVEASQRNPIVRVINSQNESFYIDDKGWMMPMSDKYTARVPVANGNICHREAERYVRTYSEKELADSSKTIPVVAQVFAVAKFIHDDPFWSSQIEQMYVNGDGDIELIPRVGDHTVLFGDATELREKFAKLHVFYTEGLNKTGWNKYTRINLKYQDQVVCTKR